MFRLLLLGCSIHALIAADEPLILPDLATLRVVDGVVLILPEPGTRVDLAARPVDGPWPGVEAPLTLNAGYVDTEDRPKGWRVIDGVETAARTTDRTQSGVAVRMQEAWSLSWLAQAPAQPRTALQAGPFLIDPGGDLGIRTDRGHRARRTAIGQFVDGRCFFALTRDAVTLLSFAQSILALPETAGLPRVVALLNLDGGPATGLHVTGHPAWSLTPTGPVADVWTLGPKPPAAP